MANFLSELAGNSLSLRHVEESERSDRSSVNAFTNTKDVLDDEQERWNYFFDCGAKSWYDELIEVGLTFSSSFCKITQEEARTVIDHYEQLQNLSRVEDKEKSLSAESLISKTLEKLSSLRERLDIAVEIEIKNSRSNLVFVKLSTRSPKDSKKALAIAKNEYQRRTSSQASFTDSNRRWRILCEEVTKATAVRSSQDAILLLLDSERIYEDLDYALHGPKSNIKSEVANGYDKEWDLELVVRAWDPRITPESEFRGICWDGRLTCLCQYFHPLFFSEFMEKEHLQLIESDIRSMFSKHAKLKDVVNRLHGRCIVDFAWLGPGEVLIIEVNPFDGVCLGTFPASTGLFTWDDEHDKKIMKGEEPFEFRVRESPLPDSQLIAQCNNDWRAIIYAKQDVQNI